MEQFNQYFTNWLYSDGGYYSNFKRIGKSGDFYTSVSTSMFFGGAIAKKIVDDIKNNLLPKDSTIIEIGAHQGYLLADIIQFIYTFDPSLLNTLKFAIVERFEKLREIQKEYLKNSFGDAINFYHYQDVKDIKEENAFVIANEIFDAFSCDLVLTNKDNVLECAYVNEHKIEFKECEDLYLKDICKKYNIQKGEVSRGYEEFAKNLDENIKNFIFITFDYGEKYPRNDFSLRIYHQHKVFPFFDENVELKKFFKNSDITYDVNFSHLIDCFKNLDISNIVYKTQLNALVDFGIIDLLEIMKNNSTNDSYIKEVQKAKTLLEPTILGERFKMLLVQRIKND